MTCMSGNRQFVDTNVLAYAHDVTAGDKHTRARAMILRSAKELGCATVHSSGSQPRPGLRRRSGPQPVPGLAAGSRSLQRATKI
jgi:hypothetical protein